MAAGPPCRDLRRERAGLPARPLSATPDTHPIFSSPLVVLTWQADLPALRKLGLITSGGGFTYFSLAKYLAISQQGAMWPPSPGGSAPPYQGQVQLAIADPRWANVGASFVAAASYVYNGDKVVSSAAEAKAAATPIAALLRKMGLLKTSTGDLFNSYETNGPGVPMILGYESEFLGARLSGRQLPPGAALLYLDTPVTTTSTVMALSPRGEAVLKLMLTDGRLLDLAERKFGFRVAAGDPFPAAMQARGITVPDLPSIQAPIPQVMEELISDVEALTGS